MMKMKGKGMKNQRLMTPLYNKRKKELVNISRIWAFKY